MVYDAPRKIYGGGAQVDILNGLYRYDEDTDRWIRIRRVTKQRADKIREKRKKNRNTAIFHSVSNVRVRTDPKTKRRYVIRRDDGMGVWR